MCAIFGLASIEDMTNNAILDTVLIGFAVLFFGGAGLFLPIWEYLEGRAPRRRRARTVAPAPRPSRVSVNAPCTQR